MSYFMQVVAHVALLWQASLGSENLSFAFFSIDMGEPAEKTLELSLAL